MSFAALSCQQSFSKVFQDPLSVFLKEHGVYNDIDLPMLYLPCKTRAGNHMQSNHTKPRVIWRLGYHASHMQFTLENVPCYVEKSQIEGMAKWLRHNYDSLDLPVVACKSFPPPLDPGRTPELLHILLQILKITALWLPSKTKGLHQNSLMIQTCFKLRAFLPNQEVETHSSKIMESSWIMQSYFFGAESNALLNWKFICLLGIISAAASCRSIWSSQHWLTQKNTMRAWRCLQDLKVDSILSSNKQLIVSQCPPLYCNF